MYAALQRSPILGVPFRAAAWIRSVARGYGGGTLDDGVIVVQKDARTDGVDIWIGAVVADLPVEELSATVTIDGAPPFEVTLHHYGLDEGSVPGVPDAARFFHNHHSVDGLSPGVSRTVTVRIAELDRHGFALCTVSTLPADLPEGTPLRVLAASCYDAGTDPDDMLDTAYRRAYPTPPDLALLVGDQVYADAPFSHYLLRSRVNPRAGLLLKYWTAWGKSRTRARRGLHGILTTGPNYFLPDDHEFWNNWPNQTITAKHSYTNILTALRNSRRRARAVLPDTDEPAVTPLYDPQQAPTDAYRQNYLPVHPAEWGKWSLASFELFGSFQTRSVPDRDGLPSRGALGDVFPPVRPLRGGPPRIHPPRNVIVQDVTVGPVTFCLLDARTRRTRRVRHPYHSGFVDREFLDAMLARAAEPAVFVLVTPQPLLVRAAWLDNRDEKEKSGLFDDVGMQDYWHQWERMWNGLIEARGGRPTITVGGDIHQSYVAAAPELSLVEVVASPMSLVWGGNALRRLEALKRGRKPGYEAGSEFVTVSEVVAGPDGLAKPYTSTAVAAGCLPKNQPGFAGLTFTRTDAATVAFDVELVDRSAPTPAAVSARYLLHLDVRGPDSVVRA